MGDGRDEGRRRASCDFTRACLMGSTSVSLNAHDLRVRMYWTHCRSFLNMTEFAAF